MRQSMPILLHIWLLQIQITVTQNKHNKYLNFFMLPGITIGFTVSSFSGQNFGGKKFERIHSGTKIESLVHSFFVI